MVPDGVASAADGTLYVSCYRPDTIYRLGPSGRSEVVVDDPAGTFQGGYYLDVRQNGDGCGYRTDAHEFAYHDYSTGFRCCADAE